MSSSTTVRRSTAAALALLACLVAGSPAGAAAPQLRPPGVEVVDLGFLGEGARAEQINDRGVVIGTFFRSGALRAFRWDDGVMSELPGLGGTDTGATSIDAVGRIAGFAQAPDGARRAVLWEPDGTLVDLGVEGMSSTATGVNRRGTVVGTYVTAAGEQRAFLWRDGVVTDLGDLPPGATSPTRPMLNDADEIAFEATSTEIPGLRLGFRWDDGVLTPLTVPGELSAVPHAINRRGHVLGSPISQSVGVIWDGPDVVEEIPTLGGPFLLPAAMEEDEVVGTGPTADGELHAFHWEDGVLTDLGTLGGPFSEATALNGRGQVVGGSNTPSTDRHATLWQDGHVVDLGTLGGPFSTATDINRRGQVVGYSLASDGATHAVLWTTRPGRP